MSMTSAVSASEAAIPGPPSASMAAQASAGRQPAVRAGRVGGSAARSDPVPAAMGAVAAGDCGSGAPGHRGHPATTPGISRARVPSGLSSSRPLQRSCRGSCMRYRVVVPKQQITRPQGMPPNHLWRRRRSERHAWYPVALVSRQIENLARECGFTNTPGNGASVAARQSAR
jgi:hypothetical protein